MATCGARAVETTEALENPSADEMSRLCEPKR
jgi:hypothetical protein